MFRARHPLTSFLCLGLLSFPSVSAFGLEVDRLWLPTEYRGHYIKLRDAALAAEATKQCHEVLRGTLDLDLSAPGFPVYRILCREVSGATYTELVDGDTMMPRSSRVQPAPAETTTERAQRLAREKAAATQAQAAEEAKKMAEAQAAAALKAEGGATSYQTISETPEGSTADATADPLQRQRLEEICRAEIINRTALMLDLEWLTEQPLVEKLANGQMRFTVEFDARDLWGTPLAYKAVCTISTPSEMVVVVSPRRTDAATEPVYLPDS